MVSRQPRPGILSSFALYNMLPLFDYAHIHTRDLTVLILFNRLLQSYQPGAIERDLNKLCTF